jgi:hypothetical protein
VKELASIMAHATAPAKPDQLNHTGERAHRGRGWLRPDDGIVDAAAVTTAARGDRPVPLTSTERLLAAALILAAGGTAVTIAIRLHMSSAAAKALVEQVRAGFSSRGGRR